MNKNKISWIKTRGTLRCDSHFRMWNSFVISRCQCSCVAGALCRYFKLMMKRVDTRAKVFYDADSCLLISVGCLDTVLCFLGNMIYKFSQYCREREREREHIDWTASFTQPVKCCCKNLPNDFAAHSQPLVSACRVSDPMAGCRFHTRWMPCNWWGGLGWGGC